MTVDLMAVEYGAALDALNNEIQQFELWMESMGFVVPVSVLMPSGGGVEWKRTSEGWRLMFVMSDGNSNVLTSASASRRVEFGRVALRLVDTAIASSRDLIAEARATTDTLRALRQLPVKR
jgi:hypothetical protein